MTLETLTLILLVAGLIPWHISRRTVGRRPNQRTRWQVYALFWRLIVERPPAPRPAAEHLAANRSSDPTPERRHLGCAAQAGAVAVVR